MSQLLFSRLLIRKEQILQLLRCKICTSAPEVAFFYGYWDGIGRPGARAELRRVGDRARDDDEPPAIAEMAEVDGVAHGDTTSIQPVAASSIRESRTWSGVPGSSRARSARVSTGSLTFWAWTARSRPS